MRFSPTFWIFAYFILGVIFTYLAIFYAGEYGVWSFWPLINMALAAYDFFNAYRMIELRRKINKMKKK
ncbi:MULTISPECIES: YdiK family protein [Bacillaceae]|uniref:YdiK family protein n=1 Tax=Bacillaceae TaxID=186817 RepID=UPI001C87C1D8|nr:MULTISPECIES: YdiK family protein [Bacillaceae]